MAPKTTPKKSNASLISVLAACSAVFAVAVVGVPMLRDWYSMQNPSHGTLIFNLNPAACKATLKGAHTSLEPCVIESDYGFDPVSKELVLFLGLEEVRMPTWERDLVSIDGKPNAKSKRDEEG